MSKEIKEIYKCDCCKQEVSNIDDLIEIILPYQIAQDTTVSLISWKMIDKYNSSKKFEICQECAKRIVEGYRTQNIELGVYPYQGWTFEILGGNDE